MVGIYLMGFVILVSGVGVLGTAIAYAYRPTERTLMLLRPLTLAAIFASICSFSGGLVAVLRGAGATPAWNAHNVGLALMGLSECVVPIFVAFGFLAVAWLLVTLGLRRQV